MSRVAGNNCRAINPPIDALNSHSATRIGVGSETGIEAEPTIGKTHLFQFTAEIRVGVGRKPDH